MNRYLYWGPFLSERDGGAVVNYYLLKRQNEIRPRDEYYGYPKVPEELDSSQLPWMNYILGHPYEAIPKIMSAMQVPVLNIFHVAHEHFEKILDDIHEVGGKVVCHQTIHWADDLITKSTRLGDIDRIVAPTEYAKRVFQGVCKLPAEKIDIIPHAVDTERYKRRPTVLRKELGIGDNQKVVLFSGRLSFWKGIQEIIPIVRPLVKEYNCVFIIRAGYFWGNKEGERLYKVFKHMSLNNPNLIFLPEWQRPEFMEELFSMTDILLSNSGHEGFNVPLVEAMSSGAVPITTSLVNHVEILGLPQCGLLIAPTVKVGTVNDGTEVKVAKSEALYGAIKWLLENREEMEAMSVRGRARAVANYDLTKICGRWLELYDSLIPKDYSMDMEMKRRVMER